MRISYIKPPVYEHRYKPNPNTNFKSSGVGIVLGWATGTVGGMVLTSKKAIEDDVIIPAFLDSLVVLASGLSGGFLGYLIEKLIKKGK